MLSTSSAKIAISARSAVFLESLAIFHGTSTRQARRLCSQNDLGG